MPNEDRLLYTREQLDAIERDFGKHIQAARLIEAADGYDTDEFLSPEEVIGSLLTGAFELIGFQIGNTLNPDGEIPDQAFRAMIMEVASQFIGPALHRLTWREGIEKGEEQ